MPVDRALRGLAKVPREVSEDLVRRLRRTDARLGIDLGPRKVYPLVAQTVGHDVFGRAVGGIPGALSRELRKQRDGELLPEPLPRRKELLCPQTGPSLSCRFARMLRQDGEVLLMNCGKDVLDWGEVDGVVMKGDGGGGGGAQLQAQKAEART